MLIRYTIKCLFDHNSTKNYPISVEYSGVIVIYHLVIFHVGATSCSGVSAIHKTVWAHVWAAASLNK